GRMSDGEVSSGRRIGRRCDDDVNPRVAKRFELADKPGVVALLEDDDLEMGIPLRSKARDELHERRFAPVGPDDDRDLHRPGSIAAGGPQAAPSNTRHVTGWPRP